MKKEKIIMILDLILIFISILVYVFFLKERIYVGYLSIFLLICIIFQIINARKYRDYYTVIEAWSVLVIFIFLDKYI